MRVVLKENFVEALIGLAVVVVALWFFAFAYQRTGGGAQRGGYHVNALFANAIGVGVGTDVRVAGLKVGRVTSSSLDPNSWQAKLTLSLDPSVKIPADSSAAITSEGIMGGSYIALLPGGDPSPLKNGDTIIDTQGSVDLMGMIGQYINQTGSMNKDGSQGQGSGEHATPAEPMPGEPAPGEPASTAATTAP